MATTKPRRPLPAAIIHSTVEPIECSGTLTNAQTGYSVQDLKVSAYFVEPRGRLGQQKDPSGNQEVVEAEEEGEADEDEADDEKALPLAQLDIQQKPPKHILLGTGITRPDGSYKIMWKRSERVAQIRCLLSAVSSAKWFFKVTELDQTAVVFKEEPHSWGTSPIKVLDLALSVSHKKLDQEEWASIQKTVVETGIATVGELVNHLIVLPSVLSNFAFLSIFTRQQAVFELEQAFLDPQQILRQVAPLPSWSKLAQTHGIDQYKKALGESVNTPEVSAYLDRLTGILSQFSSLSAVDWKIAASLIVKDLGAAVTKYAKYWHGPASHAVPKSLDNRLEADSSSDIRTLKYRDYLVKQWESVIVNIEGPQGVHITPVDMYLQLRNRFHQDFQVQDYKSAPANEILIPNVVEILTSPKNEFGFGVDINQIPARGSDTARAYLDKLLSLTNVSVENLNLRYRRDFSRPDSALSSPVWENVRTLQGFFRDSFQSGVSDPWHPTPDILSQPIVPEKLKGLPLFFLEYDEWLLRQEPIPFENYFQIRNILFMNIDSWGRQMIQRNASWTGPRKAWYTLYNDALTVMDELSKVYGFLDQLEFASASQILEDIQSRIFAHIKDGILKYFDIKARFDKRRLQPVQSLDDLTKLTEALHTTPLYEYMNRLPMTDGSQVVDDWADLDANKLAVACSMIYTLNITYPMLTGLIAMGQGDYAKAIFHIGSIIGFLVGVAEISADEPYSPEADLYHFGDLPYTVRTNDSKSYPPSEEGSSYLPYGSGSWLGGYYEDRDFLTSVEILFFSLRMGEAMLQWAENLYRTDLKTSILRARELYKGVYFVHGVEPPIDPEWDFSFSGGPIQPGTPIQAIMNPAILSQLARAQRGMIQIGANVNYFGYARDVVPALRYPSLKMAADTFAASAKSIESDFINSLQQQENLTIESFKNTPMLQRASDGKKASELQVGIANDQITQAQVAVQQVQAAIAAKQAEIDDHDSFFGQLSDFVDGLKDIWKGLPSDTQTVLTNSAATEAGISGYSTEGLLGLGAGATVTAGFGAFFVASYVTLGGMADAQNGRQSQLETLQTQNLPTAQAQLDIAQKNVQIAQLNEQIAAADAALAANLIAFTQTRFLNAEFWSYLTVLFQRILQQYLDLASRTGWLAERALSYELGTPANIMKLDYYNGPQQGTGSVEALQLDLATLEALYLQSQAETLPIKVTMSLARDFPLQFAALRTSGRCSFRTLDDTLRAAYPGTFAHRIRAVQPRLARTSIGAPLRGFLYNDGFSTVTLVDGSVVGSSRAQDGLPISEFDIGSSDAPLNGIPGPTLMPFEGSGVSTIWDLQFPRVANPGGLEGLVDVLLDLHVGAGFSPALFHSQLGNQIAFGGPSTSVSRTQLLSVFRSLPGAIKDLQSPKDPATVTISLDMRILPHKTGEKDRRLGNIYLVILAKDTSLNNIQASITANTAGSTPISFAFSEAVALSNAPPVTDATSTVAKSPLNALAGTDLDAGVTLSIDKNANPSAKFAAVQDIWVGLDYTASVS